MTSPDGPNRLLGPDGGLPEALPPWNGPVLNNALSGVDQALWDIAGKRAGLPVYELLGGRSRAAVEVYSHAAGATIPETLEAAEELLAAGYRHIRLQLGGPGTGTYGAPHTRGGYPRSPNPDGWDVRYYLEHTPELFAAARERLGPSVGGLTPTRKLVALAELLGVRTAFHSPGDISPVGVAANLAIDVSTPALSISTKRPRPGSLRSSSATTAGPPASAAQTAASSHREIN